MTSVIQSARFTFELFQLWSADREMYRRRPQLRTLDFCRRLMWVGAFVVAVCALLTYPLEASAQTFDVFSGFDGVVRSAEEKRIGWFTQIRNMVRPTFMILGTIEICWAAAIWAFERDNLSSFAVEVIKKIMTIGFFFVLLEKAPEWIPDIFDTFQEAGTRASGQSRITTDGILKDGVAVAAGVWGPTWGVAAVSLAAPLLILGSSVPGSGTLHELARSMSSLALIGAGIIMVSYAIVAAQFFCLKIESALLFAAGAIFLGMGSSTWTREYVSKYLNYAINVGVRMLVLILVLSITLHQVKNAVVIPFDVGGILSAVGNAILQAILASKVPELAGALLSGGAGLTAGGAAGAMGGAVRSAASGAMVAGNAAKGVGHLFNAMRAARAARAGGVGAAQSGGASGGAAPDGQRAKSDSKTAIEGLAGSSGGGSKTSPANRLRKATAPPSKTER